VLPLSPEAIGIAGCPINVVTEKDDEVGRRIQPLKSGIYPGKGALVPTTGDARTAITVEDKLVAVATRHECGDGLSIHISSAVSTLETKIAILLQKSTIINQKSPPT
jgi:hypothetical protein